MLSDRLCKDLEKFRLELLPPKVVVIPNEVLIVKIVVSSEQMRLGFKQASRESIYALRQKHKYKRI